MSKYVLFPLLLLFCTAYNKTSAIEGGIFTFQAVDWHNWHNVKLYDCSSTRRAYQNALLSLLQEGVSRDTVEKYLGKNELQSNKDKDKAYYYIEWDCQRNKPNYTFIILYKDDRIIKVRRRIFME